jgi:protein gp37
MEKVWATDIRDACEKAGVPFFFKQWGSFDEQGNKVKKKLKKDGLTPATLDGVVHNDYPLPVVQKVLSEKVATAKVVTEQS